MWLGSAKGVRSRVRSDNRCWSSPLSGQERTSRKLVCRSADDPFQTSAGFTAHIECVVSVTVDVAAAFEFANVNHEIHLSRRAREPEAMPSHDRVWTALQGE